MIEIREMTIGDYSQVSDFWEQSQQLSVSLGFDTRERIKTYLERNPGISTVSVSQGSIVGTALGGHDGRRGSLHHVGVSKEYRNQGIATMMINRCIEKLREEGIYTGFLSTHVNNKKAEYFWTKRGWEPAPNIMYHSKGF